MNDYYKNYLITEDVKVIDAMKKLSEIGSKILFIHDNFVLKASISDGDIRRYILKSGDLNENVIKAANHSPKYLINVNYKDAEKFMRQNLIEAVPILNDNNTITNIYFLNNNYIERHFKKIDVPVVMMAGGKGTRLYPYTKVLPKPLIPVGDIPIAERIINQFYNGGCKNFYLIVNHMKNMIKSYFNDIDKPYNIQFLDEYEPLGTGGGLIYLKGLINSTFILTNCDVLLNVDYSNILEHHNDNNNLITMIVAEQKIQVPYGVVEFDNNNKITSMKEKPIIKYYTNTGCYIVNPKVLEDLNEKKSVDFPDMIDKYRNKGENIGVYTISEDSFIDMGELDKLDAANNMFY